MELALSIEEEGSGGREETVVEVEKGATVEEALEEADINPETVLVERDGQIVPKGEEVSGSDLRVLRVISG
ncbi:MAG: MoaD/ThiS family protein, partial [Candidatus Nanohaloarchaea archaeon]|nr:MoaD/ThiS family protein [Candidatus Nanohaloarchaea archaeon]